MENLEDFPERVLFKLKHEATEAMLKTEEREFSAARADGTQHNWRSRIDCE